MRVVVGKSRSRSWDVHGSVRGERWDLPRRPTDDRGRGQEPCPPVGGAQTERVPRRRDGRRRGKAGMRGRWGRDVRGTRWPGWRRGPCGLLGHDLGGGGRIGLGLGSGAPERRWGHLALRGCGQVASFIERGPSARGASRLEADLIPARGASGAPRGWGLDPGRFAEGAASWIGAAARVNGRCPDGAPQRRLRDETAWRSRGEPGFLVDRAEPEKRPSCPPPVPTVVVEEVKKGEGTHDDEEESGPGWPWQGETHRQWDDDEDDVDDVGGEHGNEVGGNPWSAVRGGVGACLGLGCHGGPSWGGGPVAGLSSL